MPDAIKVDAIPGSHINPDVIEENARTIGAISRRVADHGSNVHFTWQGMAGVYEAPESPALLGLMAPVSSQATQVSDNLHEVSAALIAFAADVRPIKAELDSLRVQAQAFVDSTHGGVQVQEINPAWTAAQSTYGGATAAPAYQGSWGSAPTSSSSAAMPEKYRTVTKEWHESREHVDRNNELIAAVNAQQVKLWEVERTCANRIRALYGAQPLHAATSENDAFSYGVSEIPVGTDMRWGAAVSRTEDCAEGTVRFVVEDFLWEGVAVGGIGGTLSGLLSLLVGFDPATWTFFSTDAWGAAWGGIGTLAAGGLMNATPPLNVLLMADDVAQNFGGQLVPQPLRDFKDTTDEAFLNMGRSIVAWDKWQDDPGTALGESVFNIATILIPAGAAVSGVKTAAGAASALSKMAKVADFIDPAAYAMNGAIKLGGAGIEGLNGILARLGTDTPGGFHLNIPDMPLVAEDPASAMRALDDARVDLYSITARIDGGIPVYEFPPTDAIPSGRIEMPAGAFDGVGGGDVSVRADGEGDAGVAAPAREPEFVSAGGVRGETGPAPMNSTVGDAPVRTETGAVGESTVVRGPTTGTDGGGSQAGGQGGGRGGPDAGNGGRIGGGNGGTTVGECGFHGGYADAGDDVGPVTGDSSANDSSESVSPGRVYSMMDGIEHTTSWAPEHLGSSRVTASLLDRYGVTRTHFEDLISRSIDTLTGPEKAVVNGVRNELTAQMTSDTVFQKVLDQPHFDSSGKLVFGQGENIVLGNEGTITGSVSVAEDTAHLTTPADFFRSLRLDYPGTKFLPDDPSAFVLRFQPDTGTTGSVNPQLHSSMGGDGSVDHYSAPFTGNGFLKTGDDIIPEYRADRMNMRDGAEVWEVLDDGTQRLFAVWRRGEWIPVR